MRILFRLFLVVLFLAIAIPIGVGVQFWTDATPVISDAERSGALRQHGGLLTPAEHVVASDMFAGTWGMSAMPCRTMAMYWDDVTNPSAGAPGVPISQKLAAVLLADEGGGMVRRQLRRALVACQLEQRYDDARLLRAYLASANFGLQPRGIENASQTIFGKPSRDLNREEGAKLAALLSNPNLRTQPDRWTQRARAIADRMAPRTP